MADEDASVIAAATRPSKVQRPVIREPVLARPRLANWLTSNLARRLLLVVGSAGSGKTTLLAEFSERARQRTLWYRLDSSDRDLGVFVSRLVLAGRQLDPSFGTATLETLFEARTPELMRTKTTETLLRDLASLSGTNGLLLVLDDFHEVGDVAPIAWTVQELLQHGPDGLTLIIASRHEPPFPLARLRLLGEVAEMSAAELRFDVTETDALFRTVYGHDLEMATIEELTRRTEGWAASIQLVESAIRGKSDQAARRFVHSLSGADTHLHSYLAEEVLGGLSDSQRRFLMVVSLPDEFDAALAAAATQCDIATAEEHISAAVKLGLLQEATRDRGTYRFHRLVRDFLQARLHADTNREVLADAHLRIAEATAPGDWTQAVHHFVQAGRPARAAHALEAALSSILARGAFNGSAVEDARLVLGEELPALMVLGSRLEFRAGRASYAVNLASSAAAKSPTSAPVLLNLMTIAFNTGDLDTAHRIAHQLMNSGDNDESVVSVAQLQQELIAISLDGDLELFVSTITRATEAFRSEGRRHFQGVGHLNAAVALRSMARPTEAIAQAASALAALQDGSSGPERASARMVRAWALAHQGGMAAARNEAALARSEGGASASTEVALELADLETWYGSVDAAVAALEGIESAALEADQREQLVLSRLGIALRRASHGDVALLLPQLRLGHYSTAAAMEARRLSMLAHAALVMDDPKAPVHLSRAIAHSRQQHAGFWEEYLIGLVAATSLDGDSLRATVESQPSALSIHAEILCRRLPVLLDSSAGDLEDMAVAYPGRWREALRAEVGSGPSKRSRAWAAHILDLVGEKSDVALLRKAAKSLPPTTGRPSYGKGLARRLAEPVRVLDLNRASVLVGRRLIPGSEIRRKALGLITYLVTRPGFAATRDEVMDALWPDADPVSAINSLNQTAYFLRRVLEPDFEDERSPGYLRYQADLIWLDPELVSSDAGRLRTLIERGGDDPEPSTIEAVAEMYVGKFALDFAYDDWATDFRESLHAAYLSFMESVVRRDLDVGRTARGIRLARRVLEVDPDANELELLLIRLYAVSGSRSAAAEQYSHYSAVMKEDMGIEVPPLEQLWA